MCAYVAYRVYWRGLAADASEPWPEETLETAPPATAVAEPPAAPGASAEPESMVGTSMGTTPVSPAVRYEENGSPMPVAVPAPRSDVRLHEEPPTVQKPRLSGTALAVLGALVGAAAIALGAWAVVESTDSDGSTEAIPGGVESQELIAVLSQPATERIPLAGSEGRIILAAAANGKAYLVLNGLGLAPTRRSYQAWVIRPGAKAPASAAVFSGSELVVPLALAVRPGAVVAITIERAGGVRAPTQTPTIVGERAT